MKASESVITAKQLLCQLEEVHLAIMTVSADVILLTHICVLKEINHLTQSIDF